ncbi:hypothetical protein [Streptomyces sp. NPDC059894]|uniref:hypothetical protein n=1 Tax=unclassified Streptomyces TaxID=2593676 RepID=UPI003652CE1E
MPYSGSTGPRGVSVPLSLQPTEGAIGLVTVRPPSLPYGLIDLIDWDAPCQPGHPSGYDPLATCDRTWFAGSSLVKELDRHKKAGTAGVIVILDLPAEAAEGQYLPYDGIIRDLPF